MILFILLGLAAVIVIILIVASLKPNTVHYERSTAINAPPERILAHIIDFHKWAPWSPWEKLDPEMTRTYAGPPNGVGAKYGWSSKGKAGEGTMEILAAGTDGVKIDLRFIKPFRNDCATHFNFSPSGEATSVTWMMDGPNTFMGKVFSVFMDMDKMIGRDFEAGLAGLKMEVERSM